MSHLEITYTIITILVILLAWAGMALCQPRTEDISNAIEPYKYWLAHYRNRSTPKVSWGNSWGLQSFACFRAGIPEPEAITKLMEEINKNWETDIKTKDETIKSLKSQLRSEEKEALEAQKKLSDLDRELKEYNHTSIELLLAEKAQRESIDEIERAEKGLTTEPPKKTKRHNMSSGTYYWEDLNYHNLGQFCYLTKEEEALKTYGDKYEL